jgi:hypothetical protein
MSRVKKISKTKAVIVWSVTPIFIFGAITLMQTHNAWQTAALYLAWVLLGVLLANAKRIDRKFRRPRRRTQSKSRNVKPRPKRPDLGLSGNVLPWQSPAQAKALAERPPVVIDSKQMDAWADAELAEIEAAAEHKETQPGPNQVKYSIYGDDEYAEKRRLEGYR